MTLSAGTSGPFLTTFRDIRDVFVIYYTMVYTVAMAMRRFQMVIDEELDSALQSRANKERVSKAELLRRFAMERLLPGPKRQKMPTDDPILKVCGIDTADENEEDRVSENVSRILYGQTD